MLRSKGLKVSHGKSYPGSSIGVVSWQRPLNRVEELIKAADHLMHEVKNAGKNEIKHEIFENT